jgi:hypothetical protein
MTKIFTNMYYYYHNIQEELFLYALMHTIIWALNYINAYIIGNSIINKYKNIYCTNQDYSKVILSITLVFLYFFIYVSLTYYNYLYMIKYPTSTS